MVLFSFALFLIASQAKQSPAAGAWVGALNAPPPVRRIESTGRVRDFARCALPADRQKMPVNTVR